MAGPSARFVNYGDGTAALGVELAAIAGQIGAFDPPGIEVVLQELQGSAATFVTQQEVGHERSPDFVLPIYANSTLQAILDDLHGTTATDRRNLRVIAIGHDGGDVTGQRVDIGQAYLKTVKPKTPLALLTELEAAFAFTGICHPGARILKGSANVTADGNAQATSVDHGAATAFGGFGIFIYYNFTLSGATGLVVRVVDSADNVTFTALQTFATVTATTGGGEPMTLASTATVRRYLSADWDFTGSPTGGTTARIFVAFKRHLS